MALSMWMAPVLGLMIGVTSVLAAIPGPNDLRYPDYIVNPPVSCTQEGSFPHPRNCSWYYRCVDRMKVGYYWTYHFECEPGTVFLDELDQCVHPFKAPYACKPAPTTEKPLGCEGVLGTCTTYDVCRPTKTKKRMCTEIRCPLRTPNLSCGDGYAFEMEKQECAPIPTEAELCNALLCRGVPGTCKDFKVCGTEEVKHLCKEISCPQRQPNLSCGGEYYYDLEERKCVVPPKACIVDVPVAEVGNITCSYHGQRPKAEFIERWFCKDFHLCVGATYLGKSQLCDAYYECEQTGAVFEVHRRSCPPGFLYSFDNEKCETTPTDGLC